MLAYKFLSGGGTGVLSGFRWPVGEWVTVEGELVPARRGVHACRTGDLARWLDEELWAVELDGELLEADCFVARPPRASWRRASRAGRRRWPPSSRV